MELSGSLRYCGVHAPPRPAQRSPPGSFQVHPELRSGSAVSVREPYRKPAPRQTRGSSDCRKVWVRERARNRARRPHRAATVQENHLLALLAMLPRARGEFSGVTVWSPRRPRPWPRLEVG